MVLSMTERFEQLMANVEQRSFSHSRSPDKPTSQNARDRSNTHHPMSIANLASPNPIRVEGQSSIPSLPTPMASPIPSATPREVEEGPSQSQPSQRGEDVTMEEEPEVVESEDMGDTTERIGEEDVEDEEAGEVDEEGEADEDDEDSEDDEEDDESEDDEDDDDDVRPSCCRAIEMTNVLIRDRRSMSRV